MTNPISLDLCARRIVMASYLYYRLDASPITDHEFDAMCQRVATGWDQLEPIRQWQLGDAASIKASGYHVKVTTYAESGAWAWARSLDLKLNRHVGGISQWKRHKQFGHWATLVAR